MSSDEVKNEICERLGKVLKEIENSYLANEEFEITLEFLDETFEWNLTGWDKVS